MQPPKQHLKINLVEVKGQLVKTVGVERSKQYFDYLNRFLSLKLSKNEFDRLCLGAIGKCNLRLHNQLIRAVLKNVVPVVTPVSNPLTSPLTLVNGDILAPSPRKARTVVRDRRVADRKSAVGSNGSTNFNPFSSSTPQTRAEEQTESLHNLDGKIISGRTSLHAPLGIPCFPTSISGTHVGNNSKCAGVLHNDGLLDTTTLKERMEQIIIYHGLQRVSMDCANVLNNGLDFYLKSLIKSCVDLNGSRSAHKSTQCDTPQNGQMQQESKPKRLISLLDFNVAMALNCKKVGDDWPIFLEKICCTHDFE